MRPLSAVVLAVLGAAMAVLAGGAGYAAAAWTSGSPDASATFSTAMLAPASTFTCGPVGAFSVTFNWSAVDGATSYTLHYGSGGATTVNVTGTSRTITSAISGGTAWVVANRDFGSTTWTSVASTTRTYSVAAVSFCG